MTMETIEYVGSGGVTLMADVRGDPDANPILFMHGGGQTRHSWGGAAEPLAERGWQTISIDLRGHGDSGWSEEGDYEAEHFAADINAVLATLGRKAVLVGASLGGRTATFVVGNGVPDLCRAVVLGDITPKIETKGVERILAFMNKHPDGFETVEDAADAIAEYREHRSCPKDVSGLKKNLRRGRTADGIGIGTRNSSNGGTRMRRRRRKRSARLHHGFPSRPCWCAAAAATW